MHADARRPLLDAWYVLSRRRWVIGLAAGVVALTALVGSFLVTPLYRATATLQIERMTPDILTFRDLSAVDYSFAAYSDFYQTQYRLLSSDTVALKAVDRLGLVDSPAFAGAGRPGLLSRLKALVPSGPGRRAGAVDPREAAAARVQAGLTVSPVRNSHLVELSWVAPDPDLAAEVANAVADAYVQFTLEAHSTTSEGGETFLVNQIGQLTREVAELERQLQQYGESKGIVSIDDSSNITMKALADTAARRNAARSELARAEAAWRAVREAPAEGLPDVLRSDLISRLKQEYAASEAEYAQKARQFKDDWPGMQTLRARLEGARERLQAETDEIARKVRATAQADYNKALAEVRNLDALVAEQADAAQRLRRDAVDYATLQVSVAKKREVLSALMARQNEMALSTRLKDIQDTSSNIRIVGKAKPPAAPFRPDVRLNLALGLLLGLGLGVGAAFLLEYLDNTVASPAEAEKVSGRPVLALIPRHGAAAGPRRRGAAGDEPVDLVAHRNPRSGTAEAYRELRTSLLLSSPGHPPRRILVTSALPEEGKSATALNLAVVLAQLDRRVLLVDTDLRRPRLHAALGVPAEPGLSTWLSGMAPDPRALAVRTAVPGLDLLPSGPIPPNPSELLSSPLFAQLGEIAAAAGYDHVLHDLPPALSVSDPVVAAAAMDAVVVVARAGRTPRESLRLAVEKITQAGRAPTGVVLNDLPPESHGYRTYGRYGRYAEADGERADGPRASAGRR